MNQLQATREAEKDDSACCNISDKHKRNPACIEKSKDSPFLAISK
jgi:hypothetical protein